jgi:hypothetical protein
MTWRPTPHPDGSQKQKVAVLRKHSQPIIDSGMSEEQARMIFRDSGVESMAVVRDWFIIAYVFDGFEWPPVPDYSIVKPFKLFCGEILEDRQKRDLGSTYITSYVRFFVNNNSFITANTTYLLVGDGGIVKDYTAVISESWSEHVLKIN